MAATKQYPTNCHVCEVPVFVRFVDSSPDEFKVMTSVRPVAPARDCEVCGDVTCGNCETAGCPYGEDIT